MQQVPIELKAMRADELMFRFNGGRAQEGKLELKPSFSRKVRRADGENGVFLVTLSVKFESTPEEPKPFELSAALTGVFSAATAGDEQMRAAVAAATAVMFPYLRAAVTNLTSAAMAPPLVLPVVGGPLFPEDRDAGKGKDRGKDGELLS